MIKLQIHNTMGNKKELFIPKDKKNVRIYACGPTVYNYAHIGNARMAVVCDLLVRVLKEIFPTVTYVSNITDIDDKIIDSAIKNKITIKELTNKFSQIYNQDMKALGVHLPDMQPKATDYIDEIINLISKLLKNDYAYFTNKHVLFNIKKYHNYGKLSGRRWKYRNTRSFTKLYEWRKKNRIIFIVYFFLLV